MIYKRAGIALADSKQEMVYSRLARRCVRPAFPRSFAIWTTWKRAGMGDEWEAFTNALTTNLTSFFRESHHFPILADFVKTLKEPATIWCSAASTGEEPYTIAMTVCEAYGTLTPPVQIIATDIDTNVLATGANGVYPLERIDKLSPERIKKFFCAAKAIRRAMSACGLNCASW